MNVKSSGLSPVRIPIIPSIVARVRVSSNKLKVDIDEFVVLLAVIKPVKYSLVLVFTDRRCINFSSNTPAFKPDSPRTSSVKNLLSWSIETKRAVLSSVKSCGLLLAVTFPVYKIGLIPRLSRVTTLPSLFVFL